MKFLQLVAKEFYKEEGERIGEFAFLFPNRRSGLYFRRELASLYNRALFAPAIMTFKDLANRLSTSREADRAELLFDLYSSYCNVTTTPESFDQFIYWGEIILNDFNETDNYLVDAKQLFANVKELKEIESDYSFLTPRQLEAVTSFWEGFLPTPESESRKTFLATWQFLYPLYSSFRERLSSKGAAYEGMLFKELALNRELLEPLREYRAVVVVGFNQLSKAQREILRSLKEMGIAQFYWDYEGKLIREKGNPASHYMEKNLKEFPPRSNLFEQEEGREQERELPAIKVVALSSSVAQAKVAGEILKGLPYQPAEGEESAVILPNEQLLMPLLNSIPPKFEEINVTMGFPISATPLLSFIKLVTNLEWEGRGLYFKRMVPLLNHSFVKRVAAEASGKILARVVKEHIIYAQEPLFKEEPFIALLFKPIEPGEEGAKELCNKILSLLQQLVERGEMSKVEKEFIYSAYRAINRVKSLLIPMELKSFAKVLEMILGGIKIPFSGEPLMGLQIMGLLETRALDFDNIIICSFNEGFFPKREIATSFIPYNLRVGFQLPVREDEDALYSYLFYRMISRAKRLFLLYDNRTEGLKSSEPSRFLLQLKYLYNLPIVEESPLYRVVATERKEIVIEKSEKIMERLSRLLAGEEGEGLSASAVNSYIDCPLKFYLSYIEGVEAEEELSEEIEADQFGSIFHFVVEQLYKPFEGREVLRGELSQLLKSKKVVESKIDEGFKKFKNISKPTGYSFLIKNFLIKYVESLLKKDLSYAPYFYIASEKRVSSWIVTESGMRVPIKGFIDRVDRKGEGSLRIVDYKSGAGSLTFRGVESLFDSTVKKRDGVMLQMLFYAVLMAEGREELIVEPYFMREIMRGKSHSILVDFELREEFKRGLATLFEEIFNPQVPFTSTQNEEKCKWCNFNSICY